MLKLCLHVLFCLRAPPILNVSFYLFCALHVPPALISLLLCFTDHPALINTCVLDKLFSTLCNLDMSVFSNFYLIGDFNINFVCETSPFHSNLLSIVSSFDLIQVVSTEPTRVSLNTATLIDL